MIKTNQIEFSKSKYFNILARIRFSQNWYMYFLPFIAALVIHFAMSESEMIVKFLLVYGFIYPFWILVYLAVHVNSNKAESITIKRYYEIDSDKIQAFHADGSSNSFLIENISEVKQFKREMLLYFSKSEFIYMPYNAFNNNDLETFLNTIKKESKD